MTAGTELYPEQLAQLGAEIDEVSEQEIEEGLKELEGLGLLARNSTPTSLHGFSVAQGLLTARDELRQAQIDLDFALGRFTGAKHREDAAQRAYNAVLIPLTAGLHAAGLEGANEKARDADLKYRLHNHEALAVAAGHLADATAARIDAEGRLRAADTRHKALRVELAALGQLVAAS